MTHGRCYSSFLPWFRGPQARPTNPHCLWWALEAPAATSAAPRCCGRKIYRILLAVYASFHCQLSGRMYKDMQGHCHIYVIESTMGSYLGLLSTLCVLVGCPGLYSDVTCFIHLQYMHLYIIYWMRIRRCSLLILTGILVWPYTQAGVQSPDVSPGAISIYISRGGIYMARVYHTRLAYVARCTMHDAHCIFIRG